MISTLYRGKNTRIIKVNPFHDDTTANEKYRVFRDGAVVERINCRDPTSYQTHGGLLRVCMVHSIIKLLAMIIEKKLSKKL